MGVTLHCRYLSALMPGQTVTLGFRYWTDGAVAGAGFGVDDIAITGLPTDDAETDPGWTYAGFIRTTGTVTVVVLQCLLRRIPHLSRAMIMA